MSSLGSLTPPTGHVVRLLHGEAFWQMFGALHSWRIDDVQRDMEAQRRRGRILPFVRGLRLSALLIYQVRDLLRGTGLTANWGHLVDSDGRLCSCECDVIVHEESGVHRRWNGNESPVMDFVFIAQTSAVLVISCKSYLKSGNIDAAYCDLMRPFVERLWLFAECCGPRSADRVRARALESGYEKFWYLYTWGRQSNPDPNLNGWHDFVETVLQLADQPT